MRSGLKFWQNAALLIALPLALEAGVLVSIKLAQDQIDEAHAAETRWAKTISLCQIALKDCVKAYSNVFNYIANGREWSRERCVISVGQLEASRAVLNERIPDFQHNNLATVLDNSIRALRNALDNKEATGNSFKISTLVRMSYMTSKAFESSETALVDLEAEHNRRLADIARKKHNFDLLLILGFFSTLAFASILAYRFHRSTSSQVDVLTKNVTRLAQETPLLPVIQGDSELARVDQMLHKLAQSLRTLTDRERAVLRNSSELIFTVDEHYRILLVSRSSRTILGAEPETLVGTRIADLHSAFPSELERCREAGDATFEVSIVGSEFIELEVSAHWSPEDKSFYCVGHDIRARKELERIKQSFLSMVSHDLRSPLSALQAGLEVLQVDPDCRLSDGASKIIHRMQASNSRLLHLVNDLLDIDRLDSGLLTLDYELVTFNDLAEETVSTLNVLASAKDITLESDDSDQFIYCDSHRMTQVMVNLVGNAIKFAGPGTKVEIRFSDDEKHSSITVLDRGPGIPVEFIPTLFDKFTQVQDGVANKQGTGLGLAVTKKLVELHSGRIEAGNRDGGGAFFVVQLPVKPGV